MLARIKFSTSGNHLKLAELNELEEFLGESINYQKMKINEDGQPASLSWRETFDKEKVEKDPDYILVFESDHVEINESNTYIVDFETFTTKYPKLEVTVKGLPKAIGNNNDLIQHLNNMANKIEEAKEKFDKVVEFNQKCDVHVPNMGLLNINRLAFATDICTEELQTILHKGWRILAICPQPNQRRPDYILGMHVSELDGDVEVKHFPGSGREKILETKDGLYV